MEIYSIHEHIHRFAIWTAARAVQRSFTKTVKINKAINDSSLKAFSETKEEYNQGQFDTYHRICCNQIINSFNEMDVVCTYGRAAKIIAIYLKTSIVLVTSGTANHALLIHPPIDSILLRSLAKNTDLKILSTKRWTRFSENDYWSLVDLLRINFERFDWTLEVYWRPEDENNS